MTNLEKLRELAKKHGGIPIDCDRKSWRFPTIAACDSWFNEAFVLGLSINTISETGYSMGQDDDEPFGRNLSEDLAALLNKYSVENASNTPDFILAEFLLGCLRVYNETAMANQKWHGW